MIVPVTSEPHYAILLNGNPSLRLCPHSREATLDPRSRTSTPLRLELQRWWLPCEEWLPCEDEEDEQQEDTIENITWMQDDSAYATRKDIAGDAEEEQEEITKMSQTSSLVKTTTQKSWTKIQVMS